jgi:hypothetical protein
MSVVSSPQNAKHGALSAADSVRLNAEEEQALGSATEGGEKGSGMASEEEELFIAADEEEVHEDHIRKVDEDQKRAGECATYRRSAGGHCPPPMTLRPLTATACPHRCASR